jgi:hypothetical protein
MFVCHYCGLVFETNANSSWIKDHINNCFGKMFLCETYGYSRKGLCLLPNCVIHLHKTQFATYSLFICIKCNKGFMDELSGIQHIIIDHKL